MSNDALFFAMVVFFAMIQVSLYIVAQAVDDQRRLNERKKGGTE